jgi:putative cardiolipin synthase
MVATHVPFAARLQRALWILCSVLSLTGCATLPPLSTPPISEPAQPRATGSWLDQTFQPGVTNNQPASGFHLVSVGLDGLLLRIELIDKARESLDLQYYIFRSDDTGRLVQQAVLRAADRGVRVRIITDDGETVVGDEKLLLLAAHPGIEVRVFNPFNYRGHNHLLRGLDFLFHKSRLDYRMHNKLLVADGTVAMTGGRNIGNQYFQVDPDSQFGDDDVLAVGPIVDRLAAEFAEYWNSPGTVAADRLQRHGGAAALASYRQELSAPPIKVDTYAAQFNQRLRSGEPLQSIVAKSDLTWASSRLLYDSPEKRRIKKGEQLGRLMYQPMAEQIAATRSELTVVTPYFIPVPSEQHLLAEKVSQKVRVRILTNSLSAAPDVLAQAGYMRHRTALLRDGVELYEIRSELGSSRGSGETKRLTRYGNYALHAKLFVFDRTAVFIGSMNLDQRSVHLNTEMGLIIQSGTLADTLSARFDALTRSENAYQVHFAGADPADRHPRLAWSTVENGTPLELDKEPARSAWQRLEAHWLTLLPLDSEL